MYTTVKLILEATKKYEDVVSIAHMLSRPVYNYECLLVSRENPVYLSIH